LSGLADRLLVAERCPPRKAAIWSPILGVSCAAVSSSAWPSLADPHLPVAIASCRPRRRHWRPRPSFTADRPPRV